MAAAALLSPTSAGAQGLTVEVDAGRVDARFATDRDRLTPRDVGGFTAGARIRYPLDVATGLGLGTGLRFTELGGTLIPAGGASELDIALDYLELPLVVDLELPGLAGTLTPRLYAGGTLGVELACGLRQRVGPAPPATAPCEERERDLNEFSAANLVWGVLGGGGLALEVGPGEATLDARRRIGLTNVNAGDREPRTSLRHRAWTFTAGYRLALE